MPKHRIANAFSKARSENRAAFVPYLTAGDPGLKWTLQYLDRLTEAGADIIELGVPFSDPIADGPVNQRSSERALKGGTTLSGILDAVAGKREDGYETPLVLFSYFNPIQRMGVDRFAGRAARAGVDGVLIVDLPPEEAVEYRASLAAAGLDTVFLASPTTTDERLEAIAEASTGFVYYVSRLGVTGTRSELADSLEDDLARARRKIAKPIAVGFGISTPDQAGAVAQIADGVVVGSALVKLLDGANPEENGVRLKGVAGDLFSALDRKEK